MWLSVLRQNPYLAGILIPAGVAAVLMVVSFDTVGAWAYAWAAAGGVAAGILALVTHYGIARSFLAGIGSTVLSFPLLLPALFVVMVGVYAIYSVLAIVDLVLGTDLAGEP